MLLFRDIVNRFKKDIIEWLVSNPDINYTLTESSLKIEHPKKLGTYILCNFCRNKLTVSYENRSKIFKDKFLHTIKTNEIFYYIFEILITKDNRVINKPKLKINQVAILHTNLYGQVLTITFNKFNGWGEVYKVFDNIDSAENYLSKLKVDEPVEIIMYDSDYEIIKKLEVK